MILGGLHVTLVPDEAAQHADAVVIGEGELVWPQVVDDLRDGHLQPRYAADGREFDLATSPMPRFDLLDIDRYNRLTVQTSAAVRGDCEFCASSIRLTPMYKLKPVDRVIAEIRAIKRLWPAPFIEFADDNTFVNRRHSTELLRAVAGEGIRWFTETDVSVADDPELLELLRESGCAAGAHRLREPHGGRARGRRAAPQLEARPGRRLPCGHRAHPGPRHRGQRRASSWGWTATGRRSSTRCTTSCRRRARSTCR